MRRKDLAVDIDSDLVQAFLAEMTFGTLGICGEDGFPHLKPMNYVYHDGAFYFHGSLKGERAEDSKQPVNATFSVCKEYALIPSYFSGAEIACPATAYYKSVIAKGRFSTLDCPHAKMQALKWFMEKLQPEGQYRSMSLDDQEYRKNVRGTLVFQLEVVHMDAKFKFAQNSTKKFRDHVMENLAQRNSELDGETLELVKTFCPAKHR